MKLNKFWNLKISNESADIGELTLYGEISSVSWWDDVVSPKQFKEDLDSLGDIKNLNIYCNSGGGEVFAGMAIHSMLKRHSAYKTAYVDGLAASIASVVIMAADKIVMPVNAMLMIHNCTTIAVGNKKELRKMADDMDKIDESILATYVAKTGKEEKEISKLMDAETWFTAAEAVEMGFADELQAEKKLAASIDGGFLVLNSEKFDLSRWKTAPTIVENRAETQPVSNINSDLQAQTQHFQSLKTKLLDV